MFSLFPDFLIVVSQPNIVQTIHQWKYDLFSFQMMHKSQFHKMYPYDWFCAPGSYIMIVLIWASVFRVVFFVDVCAGIGCCRETVIG